MGESRLHYGMSLRLYFEEKAFGPGMVMLLREVERTGSLQKAAKNKTVIFISHRLSTTVGADKIYVMENGEIAESGTHAELMEAGGKYAYMFNLQAKKYRA